MVPLIIHGLWNNPGSSSVFYREMRNFSGADLGLSVYSRVPLQWTYVDHLEKSITVDVVHKGLEYKGFSLMRDDFSGLFVQNFISVRYKGHLDIRD